jgi:hypothetical protein
MYLRFVVVSHINYVPVDLLSSVAFDRQFSFVQGMLFILGGAWVKFGVFINYMVKGLFRFLDLRR